MNKSGLDVVAYRYEKRKLCQTCFIKITGDNTVQFSPVYRAVQMLSELKNCEECKKAILDDRVN